MLWLLHDTNSRRAGDRCRAIRLPSSDMPAVRMGGPSVMATSCRRAAKALSAGHKVLLGTDGDVSRQVSLLCH